MERILIRLAALSLVLIVVVQGIMTVDPVRFYLSWGERLEGQNFDFPVQGVDYSQQRTTIDESVHVPNEAVIVFSIKDYEALPYAKILINGQEKKRFTSREVECVVRAGDRIEIDASYYHHRIDFIIKSGSPKLAYPCPGEIYTANGTVVMVGEVIVK